MEQEGERLKSYSTAVYFHRVHEIYFPQLAEQWKYLLSIQWRYFETRVKQHPDQHGAGAHHFIINGKKKPKKTKNHNHTTLKTYTFRSKSCTPVMMLPFRTTFGGPYEQIVLTSQKKVQHPFTWMDFVPAHVCAHTAPLLPVPPALTKNRASPEHPAD